MESRSGLAAVRYPPEIEALRTSLTDGYYKYHGDAKWHGIYFAKCPFDMIAYQEIIFDTRPHLIIETGTHNGGTSLFLAHMCDLIDCGQVVTVDISPTGTQERPQHRRLEYVTGSSTDPVVFAYLRQKVAWANDVTDGNHRVLILLDSDHHKDHVLQELDLYSTLVRENDYLVLEDTNLTRQNHPTIEAGPMEALMEWLPRHPEFMSDLIREPFMTFHPKGYLKKIISAVSGRSLTT